MRSLAVFTAALGLSGCSLIDSSGVHYDYTFDSHDFVLALGDNGSATVPSVSCPSGNECALIPPPMVMNASGTLFCDPSAHCALRVEARKALTIDLRSAMTPVPDDVLRFGISAVEVKKIDYWAIPPQNMTAELNLPTPPIDLYVAAMDVKDERDPQATRLGAVGSFPAMSTTCGDPKDPTPSTPGPVVCLLPVTGPGQDALGGFVKNFRSAPFQVLAHTIFTVAAGAPVPSGTLDFFVQPTLRLSIIK